MIYLLLILTPLIGAAMLAFMPAESKKLIRRFSAAAAAIELILAAYFMYMFFSGSLKPLDFIWLHAMKSHFYLSVSGLGASLIMLTAVLGFLCVIYSFSAEIHNEKLYFALILILISSLMGVFTSRDFLLFYIFWEAILIPMFLIIGVWGGPNRVYAAIKFFLYTLVGSVLMLVGIIVLYLYGGRTFDILELAKKSYPYTMQLWLFWAFFAAFAVKVPMWPVHTWLPDAHTEAPTAGSVILAAILIKMGAYGFLRFSLPLFPDASVAMTPIMLTLSIIAIIYGAVICLGQTDLKRLIAYSSVSHMGFVTLGIFALNSQGLEGGILQMLNHGVVTGALFLSVGVIYDRTHSRQIADYGGLSTHMPIYASFFMVFTLASIGFPLTNGFIGEFLILLGGFTANKLVGVLAATGVIIGATYMLWLYQKIFFMAVNPKVIGLPDMDVR